MRTARGRVTAAGSDNHRLDRAGQVGLGLIRVAGRHRPTLGALARDVASLPPATDAAGAGTAHGTEGGTSALALVGLVRSGVEVRAVTSPSGLVWRRPRTPAEAADALADVTTVDEDRVLLDAAVKTEDGFFATFFVSSYSPSWVRWCARHGWSPNQVTVASMAVGVAAAVSFAVGTRWTWVLGAVLLQLAFTLDCVDGQLARYTGRFSALGAWLDAIFDRGKEYAVYAGLAVGGIRAGDDSGLLWTLAGAALALQVVRHSLDFGYAAQQERDLAEAAVRPVGEVDDAGTSFWEPDPVAPVDHGGPSATGPRRTELPAAGQMSRWSQRIIAALRSAEGIALLRWAKRVVVLPIGERFLLLSLVTALVHPRAALSAVLVWGSVATLYTAGGRVVRSTA